MSFSSFYSVVNAIKDKSAEAMTMLSSDLQDLKSVVQEDVAELSKSVRQNIQVGRLSMERKESDQKEEKTQDEQDQDSLTSLKNSLFSFDMGSTLESLHSVGSTMQGPLDIVQDSLTSVGSKLTSLNVGSSLESLEVMGSKLLNSADEFLGTLAGDTVYEDEEILSESELSARRFRVLALQEDSKTYIEPPLDVNTFEKWKLVTSIDELAEIEKEVLESYPTVGAKFAELVPSVVGADVFWAHYIYKASLLAAQEQRGADLLEHALNDNEEEIDWNADSPKAKDDDGKPIFPDDECKEEEKMPTSGRSRHRLAPRRALKNRTVLLADSTLDEGDEAAGEGSLDWGDDDDLLVPEETTAAAADAKVPEATPVLYEDSSKRGEDWGEWD
ncbi:unnamed protein product [Peronospora destructor]|uniref:BSD domain-containing protein n=1 Tax=Peronospora destructor TaxID=86335 RepID=A0AAV0U1X4_9STRA|nr:unnamed protein product [Peronospora destructor]